MDNIHYVYFFQSSLIETNISELEVCVAMEEVLETPNILGCQKVKNQWKLFVKNETSQMSLLQCGLNIRNQKIDVFSDLNQTTTNTQRVQLSPVKVTIKDIPIGIQNECVEKSLKDVGAILKSTMKFSQLRDSEGQLTPYLNGDRFVYVDPRVIQSPLPRFLLIGSYVARIFHSEQKVNTQCNKCLSSEHPTFKCTIKVACIVCNIAGHLPGSTQCEFYTENNNAYTFGGRKDPLGFSNFTKCSFQYRGIDYLSREIAYQHQRALASGQKELADFLQNSSSAQEAKELSKCIRDKNPWSRDNFDLMSDICLTCASQNRSYRKNILKTDDRLLVESLSNQYLWSSGLTHEQTKKTRPDKFPGKNEMGLILMNIRDTLKNDLHPTQDDEHPYDNTITTLELNPESKKPTIMRKPSGTPPGGADRKRPKYANCNNINSCPNPLYEKVS